MKNVTFYLMNSDLLSHGLTEIETLTCNLSAYLWRKGKRILILCENQKQAYQIDESLWILFPDSFVAHNLINQGPVQGAPIEISWSQHKVTTITRDLLICMIPKFSTLILNFNEVIDFVPFKDSLKNQARERYKAYRNFGFHLNIASIPQKLKSMANEKDI